jgi:SAM-dependent methyltransferase
METDASHWQQTAERYGSGRYMDPSLAQHTREVNLELIHRWAPDILNLPNPRILKTDAFADATCPARAFSWFIHQGGQLVCFDIAPGLALQGRSNAHTLGRPDTIYVTADARFLPFGDDVFDLIVSDSTLDHFHTVEEIDIALGELARILKPGGVMIVALDNPHNITDPLFQLWQRRGRMPYFVGKTLTRQALVASLERLGLRVTDTTAQLHYPRLVTKRALRWARRIAPHRTDRLAGRTLAAINRLERYGTKYLTGLFVVARAEKPRSAGS